MEPPSSPRVDDETAVLSSPVRSLTSSPIIECCDSSPIHPTSSPVRSRTSSPIAPSPTSSPVKESDSLTLLPSTDDHQQPPKRKKYEFFEPWVCIGTNCFFLFFFEPRIAVFFLQLLFCVPFKVPQREHYWPADVQPPEADQQHCDEGSSCTSPSAAHMIVSAEVLCEERPYDCNEEEDLSYAEYNLTDSSSEGPSSNSSEECSGSSSDSSDSAGEIVDSSDNEVDDSDSDDVSCSAKLMVCEGCPLSLDEGVLNIMTIYLKRKLEKEAVGDFLECLLKFLPKHNNLPKTQYSLFKFVKDLIPLSPEIIHYYCADCQFYLGEVSMHCTVCNGEKIHKFFQLSISDQIKNLFENHGLADSIDKYSSQRQAAGVNDDMLTDLCDGSEFKRARINGQYSLTLLGHSDGISISESSKVSLWPVEFVIAEVPLQLRFKFIIVGAVWLDEHKPYMNTFLKPTVQELKSIAELGVKWVHPKTAEEHVSRVTVPVFSADAPARAQIQNILNHGGKNCCNICEQKMKKLPAQPVVPGVKKKPKRRVFTFQENIRLRTAERMEAQGNESRRRQQQARDKKLIAVKGVRGKSVVTDLPGCDRSTVVFPEYMHLLLCIVKGFFRLWFEKDGPWSLKDSQDRINEFLVSIRVPDFVTRIPRSTEHYKKWKANELRSFLLYYSIIILSECMKEEYFQHWMLLVLSLHLLLQESVSKRDIQRSQIMLNMFCRKFSKLYKHDHFTYYVHNLIHLPLTVLRYGPLWCNSVFQFESFNGLLAKFIHGTKNQAQELVNNIQLAFGIQVLKSRVGMTSSNPTNQDVEFRNPAKGVIFSDREAMLLSAYNFKKPIKLYYRASTKQKEVYTSCIYQRQKKRNNFTICYLNSNGQREFGEIKYFCECSEDPTLRMALVSKFSVDHVRSFVHEETRMIVKHIIPIIMTGDICLVNLNQIISKVIRVNSYLCLQPNKYEVNL